MKNRGFVFLSFFIFILCIQNCNANTTEQSSAPPKEKKVRGCNGWGFFAEFLWVLNHLEWCTAINATPLVVWNNQFAYYSPEGYNGSTNCWEYYFEQVSDLTYDPVLDYVYGCCVGHYLWYHHFTTIWDYSQYINTIDLLCCEKEKGAFKRVTGRDYPGGTYPVCNKHLYNEDFRKHVKDILDRFVKIKAPIQEKIDNFYQSNMEGKRTIGIHLRGQFLWNEVEQIPIEVILAEANKYADGNTQFFVASNNQALIQVARDTLNGPVINYDAVTAVGVIDITPWREKLHPRAGEDVLIEVLLMSKCDFFIHTISQVSTTVLYFNPTLEHTVFY